MLSGTWYIKQYINNLLIYITNIFKKRKVYYLLCLPLNSALGLMAPDRSLTTTDDRRHRTKARPKLSSVRRRRGNVGQICTACPTCPCRKTASHIPTPSGTRLAPAKAIPYLKVITNAQL